MVSDTDIQGRTCAALFLFKALSRENASSTAGVYFQASSKLTTIGNPLRPWRKMTRVAARIFVLTSLLGLIACGRLAAPFGLSTEAPERVVISGQADGAPEGCGIPEVGQHLVDFASAFNDGKPEAAETYFTSRAPFAWYSAPAGDPEEPSAIYSTDDLPKYFDSGMRKMKHSNSSKST